MENILEKVAQLLQTDSRIEAAYLFGSRAKAAKSQSPRSDTDIALFLKQSSVPKSLDIAIEWSLKLERLISGPVDVVILNTADPFLRFQVYHAGTPLFERDPKQSRDFEIRSLYEYWDFLPIQRMIEENSIERLKNDYGQRPS